MRSQSTTAIAVIAACVPLAVAISRLPAANVAWLPDANGAWNVAANWSSSPALPGAADDVTIDVGGATVRTITHSTGITTIHSLLSQETVTVSGGSLRISGGSATLNGPLTVQSAGTISIDGPAATLTAPGGATLGGSVQALGGATADLPSVTFYDGFTSGTKFLRARGATGLLDLSGVTTLRGTTSVWLLTIDALDGGEVDLSALTAITGGNTTFRAQDAGSYIDLSSLVTAGPAGGTTTIEVFSQAAIDMPLVTAADNVRIAIHDDGQLPTSQLTSLTHGAITLDATTRDLAALSNIDFSDLSALDGGVIALPAVTAYNGASASHKFLKADGASSRLDLSSLTQFAGSTGVWITNLDARTGAVIDLPALTSMTNNLKIYAEGTGSRINLPNLPKLGASTAQTTIEVRSGGVVDLPLLTHYNDLQIILRGTGVLDTAPPTAALRANLTVDATTRNFSTITTFDHSSVHALGGGVLGFPNVTQYNSFSNSHKFLDASGAGSLLDLSQLTQLRGSSGVWITFLESQSGGTVDLSQLTSIPDGSVFLLAEDPGSVIRIPQLAAFGAANFRRQIEVRDQGVIELPLLVELNNVDAIFRTGGQINTSVLTSATHGSITVDDTVQSFATMTSVDHSSLYARGGATLSLPAVTAYDGFTPTSKTLQAFDPGSRLDLSTFTQLRGSSNVWFLSLEARNGGVVDLSQLASIPDGNLRLYADGANSRIDLPQLPALSTADFSVTITVANQGVVHLPLISTLDHVAVVIEGTGQLDTLPLTSLARGSFTLDTTSRSFTALTNVDDSQLAAVNAATLELPAVTTAVTALTQTSAWTARGAGSRLSLPALTHIQATNSVRLHTVLADIGGHVDLPALEQIAAGDIRFMTTGAGSKITIGKLHLPSADTTLNVATGGTLEILKNFSFANTVESQINLDAATLVLAGAGPQTLEIGGQDLGVTGPATGNFGIGQLVVGQSGVATTANLVDFIDNGNRAALGHEALYLHGLGAADGLQILGGSTLAISGINGQRAYARVAGVMTDLHSLFAGPNMTIPFDQGFLTNGLPGDFNFDVRVNGTDIDLLCGAISAGSTDLLFDLDHSGVIDSSDSAVFIGDILETFDGDANLDHRVDRLDATIVAKNFAATGAGWAIGDFTCDAQVDLLDLNVLNQNIGSQLPAPSVAAVPEPPTVFLSLIALISLVARLIRSTRPIPLPRPFPAPQTPEPPARLHTAD